MFIDYAKIYVRSGKGGDGHISFRRELYVPNGGPDGGDGGKGGDIIFEIDNGLNTLLPFKHKTKFITENGQDGMKKKCHGKNGRDLVIKVPNGTVIKETNSDKIIYDMTSENSKIVLLKGGKGGIGNMHFATSVMQAPKYARVGESSKELYLTLELKVLADVGLVGFPNVGKSSLIRAVSNARPEVNNYHFTTINPHLGVCKVNNTTFTMADIPGIIENANEGAGMGYRFLKHIERTKILLHVIDIASIEGRDPLNDLNIVFNELKKFGINFDSKIHIIVANKIDSIDDNTLNITIDKISKKYPTIKIFKTSVIKNDGIKELLTYIANIISNDTNKLKIFNSEIDVSDLFMKTNEDEYKFEKISENKFKVSGEKIKKMLGYTNLETEKGMDFFQNYIKKEGIIKDLKKLGLNEGDMVVIENIEFEYYE